MNQFSEFISNTLQLTESRWHIQNPLLWLGVFCAKLVHFTGSVVNILNICTLHIDMYLTT